jgi:uncharacterized protein YkwD
MALIFNKMRVAIRPFASSRLKTWLVSLPVLALLGAAVLSASAAPPGGKSESAPVSTADPAQLETQMWNMVNQDRTSPSTLAETKGRARPLEWDSRLAAVARAHSEEMAANGYFSHQGMDGSSPSARVSNAGIRWRAQGENIAKAADPAQAEGMFMDEPKFQPNHRGNILKPDYNRVGIGIARAPDGSLYITQEFAQIP